MATFPPRWLVLTIMNGCVRYRMTCLLACALSVHWLTLVVARAAEFDMSGHEVCVPGELPCALSSLANRPPQRAYAMSGWLDADYLMWWTRGASLPPLVSSSSYGVPRQQAGVLGESTTDVVFGDERVNGDLRSGVRLNAGIWLDDCRTRALQLDFLTLESASARFATASDDDPILARPFTDATTGRPSSELISYPGVVAGGHQRFGVRVGFVGLGAGMA